jgi:LemA protein
MVALVLAMLIGGSIYYFNILVQTEQDVLAAWAKVDALQQRRNDISINLSKAVLDYSRHEQSVFTAVVSLRSLLSKKGVKSVELEETLKKLDQTLKTGAQAPASIVTGAGPLSTWDRLLAVAEQYPDLKLSSNFQSLMTALIDVEKDLAAERIRYNDAANLYTTIFYKFPTNFYVLIFGFKPQPYFEATSDAKRFKPIDY